MKKILSYSLALVSVIALSSCSVTEDNIVPPIDGGDTIITIAERKEVFEACNKKSVELNNLESYIPSVVEDRINCPDSPVATIPVEQAYGASFGFPTAGDGSITFKIAENYNIRPDTWNKNPYQPGVPLTLCIHLKSLYDGMLFGPTSRQLMRPPPGSLTM